LVAAHIKQWWLILKVKRNFTHIGANPMHNHQHGWGLFLNGLAESNG